MSSLGMQEDVIGLVAIPHSTLYIDETKLNLVGIFPIMTNWVDYRVQILIILFTLLGKLGL